LASFTEGPIKHNHSSDGSDALRLNM